MENELRFASIIHAYKLKTVSNLKSLKGNLVQLITEFYLIAKERSEHEKQVSTDQVDKRNNSTSPKREIIKNFFPHSVNNVQNFPS